MRGFVTRPAAASVTLLVAASPAVGGCGSTGKSPAAGCLSKSVQPAAPGAAAGWTLPGGDLVNTRDVGSLITSSNVSHLGWRGACRSTGSARAAVDSWPQASWSPGRLSPPTAG